MIISFIDVLSHDILLTIETGLYYPSYNIGKSIILQVTSSNSTNCRPMENYEIVDINHYVHQRITEGGITTQGKVNTDFGMEVYINSLPR
jgi:hypothetical protein